MKSFELTAVVPAAGLSSRMGAQKALLPIGNLSAVEHIIRCLRQGGIQTIRVVTGHRQDKLIPVLQAEGVEHVENPHYLEGMFSSVKTGLSDLGATCAGVFVLPVDIPLVRPSTLRALIRRFADALDCICYPNFQGRRGHPPLMPIAKVADILDWQGGGGLKACLAENEPFAIDVAVPDGNILFDIDTPEDYEEAQQRCERLEVPSAAECDVILREIHPVSEDVFQHCRRVAQVADAIASALLQAGACVDVSLVHAAAMLHDIAKSHSDHAKVGAGWLAELGFSRTGAVVALHTDIPVRQNGRVGEPEIVYLADKFVSGRALMPLQARFDAAVDRFGSRAGILKKIQERRRAALSIERCIASIVRRPVMEILLEAEFTEVGFP